MSQHFQRQTKRFRKGWIALACVLGGAALFYKPIVLFGCKAYLKHKHLSFQKIGWEQGSLAIAGLQANEPGMRAGADKISIAFGGDVFRLQFQPRITVVRPQIAVASSSGMGAPSLPILYQNAFFRPQWEIVDGVVELASQARLYVGMKPGPEKESIGCMAFSYDPAGPAFLSADLAMRGKRLHVGFKLFETQLDSLLPFLGASVLQRAQGNVEAEGLIVFNRSFKIEELHCRSTGKEVDLFVPTLGIDVSCEAFDSSFSYPAAETKGAFWDRISASLFLKSGACHLDAPLVLAPFGMEELNGEMKFEPQQEPLASLSGKFALDDQKMPFSLTGKGGVQGDGTFWSEVDLQCKKMHSVLSLYSQDTGEMSLHLKVAEASFEQIDFLRRIAGLPGQCVEGIAHGEAMLQYADGNWNKASLENCLLEKICWYFPDKQTSVCSHELKGDCALLKSGEAWSLDAAHLSIEEGNFLDPHLQLERLTGALAVEKGALLPSQLKGEWGGLQVEASLVGNQADIKAVGNAGQLLKISSSLPVTARALAVWDKQTVNVEGSAELVGEKVEGSLAFVSGEWKSAKIRADRLTPQSYGAFLPLLWKDALVEGALQCEAELAPGRAKVQFGGEAIVVSHPLAALAIPQIKKNGACLVFDKEWRGEVPLVDASMEYKENGLCFNNIEGALKVQGDSAKLPSFYAECEGLALRGDVELSFAEQRISLATSQIAGDVASLQKVLKHFPSLPSVDTPIAGNFSSGDKGFVFAAPIAGGEAAWSFRGMFDALQFPVNGSTSLSEGSCEASFDSQTNRLVIEQGEGSWQLKDGTLLSVQLKRAAIDAGSIDLALFVVDGKKEYAHIEASAKKTAGWNWEIACDKQATHFAGMRPNITRFVLKNDLGLASFEMRPLLRAQDLSGQIALFQNAGFFTDAILPKTVQEWKLEGAVQACLSTEDWNKGFSLQAESRDLKMKGSSCTPFQLKAQKIKDKWQIEKLEAGGLSIKGIFDADAAGVSSSQFEGSWQGVQMKGSGIFKYNEKRYSCSFESLKGDLAALKIPALKGTFAAGVKVSGDFQQAAGEANFYADLSAPLSAIATSSKAVRFAYKMDGGLALEGCDLLVKNKASGAFLASLRAAKFTQSAEGFSVEQMQYAVSPACLGHLIDAKILPAAYQELEWDGNLEGSGDLRSSTAEGVFFAGVLKPGRYGYCGKSLAFEQLQARYEKELLTFRAKTQIEEEPLWGALQLSFGKETAGALKLFDNPKSDGLKILFSSQAGNFNWESIQGSCYGLNCNLSRSAQRKVPLATVLTGEVKMDGTRLIPLFPKAVREGLQTIKFGNGYAWQGDLVLWQEAKKGFQAVGTLFGSEFEALGYRFRRLEGTLDATPEHIVVNNIKIDDAAGTISIRKIEFDKKTDWHLNIPQIIVDTLQPSMMRKIGVEAQTLKPFTIRHFTLSDIKGKLGDKSTLEGTGRLLFSNQFKKEASIFDAPIEMLKKIGLDPGLLTPIQGELEMELRGDKFYLLSLRDSISEGSRSEFFLAPDKELSYIDLDGKMHIDLQMKQDVMLKITEAFTLTIRGTLEKPRYGLQY